MSATLYFTDSEKTTVRPWACQCVLPLSSDPIDREMGWGEPCGCEDKDCNMSNHNARAVFAALGMNTDFENASAMLPQELWAACGRFLSSDLAELVDCGKAPEFSASVIDCGRGAGYITRRVNQIHELCELAMLSGAVRCYFC